MSVYRILIISKQVEEALQVAADALIGQGQLSCDQDSDHITYRYDHPEYGVQSLMLTVINDDWATVSFAGREEFLQIINSEGWYSSAESLLAFFEELGVDVSFDLHGLDVYEFDKYAVFTRSEETDTTVRLTALARKLGVQVEVQEVPVEDERIEVAPAVEDVASVSEQDKTTTQDEPAASRKSWVRRMGGRLRKPTIGEVSLGVGIAALGAGAYLLTRAWLEG